MTDSLTAGSSLVFYTGKNYAGTAQPITHGMTGELAGSSTVWDYQSIALSGMDTYVFSTVNTADASVNYLGHVEAVISVSQADLTLLYPSSNQFPLNYLGLDPAKGAVVWLDVNATQAAPNAVASTALPGGGSTPLTTLSLPGRPGALGFVAKTEGSSVVANCRYGDYNTTNGTVTWSGTGTLILEYIGGTVTLINAGGFPAGWTFSNPQLQGDGSWVITLDGGVPASDTITSVTANPASIVNDGVSSSVITATVLNGSGQPASGESITWTTTLGTVTPASSVTDVNGLATTTLTDSGTPGTTTVTATITGSTKSVNVSIAAGTIGLTLYSGLNWTGNSRELAEHNSILLRNEVYGWDWESVKTGGERLLSHTPFTDTTAFDFRTYRDAYSAEDMADLTTDYPELLSSPVVQATALGENDVIVRVAILPDDRSQKVVACAVQNWPQLTQTASVVNGAATVEGVLVVMDRTQGVTGVPLQVGIMDDNGMVTWQYSTSLVATWDEAGKRPIVVLGQDAPADWVLLPCQPTANAGEYRTVLSGVQIGYDFDMYCGTDALISQVRADSFNTVAFYGKPGTSVMVSVTAPGKVSTENPVVLDDSGYGRADISSTGAGTITVTAQSSGRQKVETMKFVDNYMYIGRGHYYQLTQNAPADGRTPNMIYSQMYIEPLTVTGNAVFENGTNSFTPTNSATKLYDSVAETVTLNLFNVKIGDITFVAMQS